MGMTPNGMTGDWFEQNYDPASAPGSAPANGGGYVPPGSQGAPSPAPQTGGTEDPDGFRAAWFASGGRTNQDLVNFVNANPQYGAKVFGSKNSKVIFPSGRGFQAVRSAGLDGGQGPAWDDITNAGGGNDGGVGRGSLIFNAPSKEDFYNSPFYGAGFAEGQKALEGSAAARGTLLSGGTLKRLAGYGMDYGMQQYNTLFNQRLQGNQQNVGNLKTLADLGKPA